MFVVQSVYGSSIHIPLGCSPLWLVQGPGALALHIERLLGDEMSISSQALLQSLDIVNLYHTARLVPSAKVHLLECQGALARTARKDTCKIYGILSARLVDAKWRRCEVTPPSWHRASVPSNPAAR